MTRRYRFTVADGSPSWSRGFVHYESFWGRANDRLRFHRGNGFNIEDVATGKVFVKGDRLTDVAHQLQVLLDKKPFGTALRVRSLHDNYDVKAETIDEPMTEAQVMEAHLRAAIGTPYVLGGASLQAMDCSGETLWAHAFAGIELPHNARLQHELFTSGKPGFISFHDSSKLKPMDLVFLHDDEHVAPYLDDSALGPRVIDEEPHDAGAPPGWPTGDLGVGLRIRPASGNYYCAFKYATGFGRVVAINGAL